MHERNLTRTHPVFQLLSISTRITERVQSKYVCDPSQL